MKRLLRKKNANWTHDDLRAAREALGLDYKEAALVLEIGTDRVAVARMERDPGQSTHRKPAVRVVSLYKAMLHGWRPENWPERLARVEAERDEFNRTARRKE